VRRRKALVGDVEHVVVPRMGEVAGGLFGDKVPINLLWQRLDELVRLGTLTKHLYGEDQTTRYGEKYRGVNFKGFTHELFCADARSWGATLLIRTGPADYSKMVVTRLLSGGLYRQRGGYLVHVQSGEVVLVPDEQTYCRMAGVTYLEPKDRR
jgi:DNA polymerase/3'-5' exonuclease PolX